MSRQTPKVLAVASGGGHWVQLRRIAPAFEGADVIYVTVESTYRDEVGADGFRLVVDATRWNKLRLLRMLLQIAWVVFKERPDVVVSTGAAPGYFAIRLGKLVGAKTMWIDSIANVEHLSMSGQKIMPHADRCLTQWEHLTENGAEYVGAVL
ncbi:MAG: UDP-N-acetylglucosamine--LPS N-acetylglucosamine transferase [Phycisphaerales bacterium]